MGILDSVQMFDTRRSGKLKAEYKGVSFSIGKNKKGYESIKFYIRPAVAEELKIENKTKIRFGCDKTNTFKWYLVFGELGYTVKMDEKTGTYSCLMNLPFKYELLQHKKMQSIPREKLEVHPNEKVIVMFIDEVLRENELELKEEYKGT
jgi:hypothetical protein